MTGTAFHSRWAMVALALFAAAFAARPASAQQAAAAVAAPDYTLSAGDQLDVAVWKEPDISKTVIVRPDGKFSYPLVGEVVAAGKTCTAIQNDITGRLKKYIPDPVVTATVTGLDGNKVYVIGQVNKPGAFVMNPRLNILQALTMAGGMTAFAASNDIIVLRGNGAAQQRIAFHYGDVSKGRNLNQNVMLESGDVVVVP
jgi:polysaccharide export outer membrane protein